MVQTGVPSKCFHNESAEWTCDYGRMAADGDCGRGDGRVVCTGRVASRNIQLDAFRERPMPPELAEICVRQMQQIRMIEERVRGEGNRWP